MKRDEELANFGGALKIDEFTDGAAYSVYESSEEYFKQWAKDNAEERGRTSAVRIRGVKTCKNGNICIYGPLVVSGELSVNFLSPAQFCALAELEPKVIYDADGVPDGVEVEADDNVLKDKLYDKRLVLLDGKPIKIK